MENQVTFAAFSDLHLDIMNDGERRLNAFLEEAEKSKVDFIIQLGDFAYPDDTSRCECAPEKMPVNLKLAMEHPPDVPKKELLARFNGFPKPAYHVLGNHEMDFSTKEDALAMYGMSAPYYSFRCKGWHFLVLDGSHVRDENGKIADYRYGKYFESSDLPYLGEEQLAWLEGELSEDTEPAVLFCHQPMNMNSWGFRSLKDAAELKRLLLDARARGKETRLCMNGHIHRDRLAVEDGIVFYSLNSISNYWAGPDYETLRYSPGTDRDFPNLRFTLPYQRPVFAVITLNETGMYVRGRRGRFVQPGPLRTGVRPMPSAGVKDREILWESV